MRDKFVIIFSYLHGIWQYRWSALVIAWIVAGSGWAIVSTLPDKYTSSAIVLVDTKSVIEPLLKGLAVNSDIDDSLDMMTRVLLKKKNLEKVVQQTDLDLQADSPEKLDDLVKQLAGSITLTDGEEVYKSRDTVYMLSYEAKSPELTYQVVSKLLNIMIETTLSEAQTDTASAQSFLDEQIAKYAKRLSTTEKKLAQFRRANVGYMPDDKTGGYYAKLQQAQNEVDDVRSQIRVAKHQLSEMKKQLSGEKPLVDNSAPQAEKLREYRTQLAELRTQFTEQHPDIQSLRSIIAELLAKGDGANNVDSGVPLQYSPAYQDLKVEFHRVTAEVANMKTTLSEKLSKLEVLKKSADILPDVEAKLAELNRDYEFIHKRYREMVERKESALLAQEVGLSGSNIDFKIVSEPKVAKSPSGPPRMILNSVAFLAAIIAGLGWGYLRYLMHPTYIDTSQLKDNIDIPVLGSIGLHVTTEHRRRRRIQLMSFLSTFSLLLLVYGLVIMPGIEDSGEESTSETVSTLTSFKENT